MVQDPPGTRETVGPRPLRGDQPKEDRARLGARAPLARGSAPPEVVRQGAAPDRGSRARPPAPQDRRGVGPARGAAHLPSLPAVPERPACGGVPPPRELAKGRQGTRPGRARLRTGASGRRRPAVEGRRCGPGGVPSRPVTALRNHARPAFCRLAVAGGRGDPPARGRRARVARLGLGPCPRGRRPPRGGWRGVVPPGRAAVAGGDGARADHALAVSRRARNADARPRRWLLAAPDVAHAPPDTVDAMARRAYCDCITAPLG